MQWNTSKEDGSISARGGDVYHEIEQSLAADGAIACFSSNFVPST
jgi:hypothetical protein